VVAGGAAGGGAFYQAFLHGAFRFSRWVRRHFRNRGLPDDCAFLSTVLQGVQRRVGQRPREHPGDGAMGTMVQQRNLTAADFGGPHLEGCNENLVVTRPDVILDIHRAYFRAGADMVETDTFGGTPLVLAEYGLEEQAHQLNVAAARLARQAAEEFSTPGRPR